MTLQPVAQIASRRSARMLAGFFLLLSLLVSLALLTDRNLYDDEQANFSYIGLTPAQVIADANAVDVHPPGQYLLTNLSFRIVASPRWITLFPLLLFYSGLTCFVLAFAPLLPGGRSRLTFLLLSCLHPELLMWVNSVRWYSSWTGLALLTVVVGLAPFRSAEEKPTLSMRRAFALGLLLAALFYLNYITMLWLPPLLAALAWRYGRRVWRPAVLMLVVAIALSAPQWPAMASVHMAHSHGQRAGWFLSAARLAQGLLVSEAYLPWHPIAIAMLAAGIWLLSLACVHGLHWLKIARRCDTAGLSAPPLACVLLWATGFAALVWLSGLGNKPRSALVLVPLLAAGAALLTTRIRPQILRDALLALTAVWCVGGAVHLLRHEGIAKGSMIDRPDELIAALRQQVDRAAPGSCRVVVTYDAPLALEISLAGLAHTQVLTTSPLQFDRPGRRDSPDCRQYELVWVKTYLDTAKKNDRDLLAEVTAAEDLLPTASLGRFSHDPDAATKRRLRWLTGEANLPDDRIVADESQATPAQLAADLRALPDLVLIAGTRTGSAGD